MPASEERREVSENLRSMCACGCKYAEEFYELLVDTVMDEWDFHSFGEVADRLADLIEPEPERTCKRRKFYDGGGTWYEGCSKCRNPLDERDLFCSKCGAKVVDE